MNPVFEGANSTNMISTTTISSATKLIGIFVSSASGGSQTIKVADGAVTKVNTFVPLAGVFYPMPTNLATSAVITIAGTLDCCVFWGN